MKKPSTTSTSEQKASKESAEAMIFTIDPAQNELKTLQHDQPPAVAQGPSATLDAETVLDQANDRVPAQDALNGQSSEAPAVDMV